MIKRVFKSEVIPCSTPSQTKQVSSILEIENGKSKVYKGVALFYGIVYFIDALMTVGRFDLFASSELFPGTEMTYFLTGLVAVCVALSFCGIGALGRASTIFTLVVVSATVFASFTLSKEVDFLNFTPLFENGVGKFIVLVIV